ncbi:MAG: Smr/MutS family protein [Candidatus Anaerobiospirillum pullicola]|uniref:Smr/MutS family protein n=1 Tax=Candidatus Anaerobiospirillum pullicola TaxID=2838451 RepID=A0A948WZI2_9GAMM|nr:Smr/MutS family protein [Candidatus Anaerobiospirillum pullicola]
MAAKSNASFEDLLKEEVIQHVHNIDLVEKVGKVKRMTQDKVATQTPSMDRDLAKIKQEAAVKDTKEETIDYVSSTFVPMVAPNEVLSYRSPGAQPFLLKKLKNGEYREADFIDLHGKTVEAAYEYTRRYILYARERGFRCILIIHGKGERDHLKRKATIKSYLAHWLKQMPEVLAYHSAPEWKGGTGALMVILKKGDKASFDNRELHALRTR